MASGVGASYVLGIGASGKAMLAHLPDETVEQVVASKEFQATSSIGKTVAAVQKALATIRRDGYAISMGETVSGAAAIALPIVDARGYARASLNITGPETRWTKVRMTEHLDEAREITDWIEKRLGRT
jgi:DNA-binding IclR family transcriptional regulator